MMDVAAYLVMLSSYRSGMCQVPNKEFQSLLEQTFLKQGLGKLLGQ